MKAYRKSENSTFLSAIRAAILVAIIFILAAKDSTFAGQLFFAVGYHGEFTHIDASTGEVPPTRYDLPSDLQALATSPSGVSYTINYFDSPSGLWIINPLTGDTQYLLRPKTVYPVRGMAFSPAGQLYVTVENTNFYLGIVNVTDGSYSKVGRLFGDAAQADGLDFSPDGRLYGTVGGKLYTIDT
jgi:hypothetical protein